MRGTLAVRRVLMNEVDLAALRRTYAAAQLREEDALDDPIAQLRVWLAQAVDAGVTEANAMCLCTASAHGHPSARMVLLRGLDERGLRFFTSYFSRKGAELGENPQAAVVFYWPLLERQARVEGSVERLSDEESDAYFASRPRGHQLGAWASEQSEAIADRALLDQRLEDFAARFQDEAVPRPHSWGGYLVRPERIEFWQGRPDRLHDRLQYARTAGGWERTRLQP